MRSRIPYTEEMHRLVLATVGIITVQFAPCFDEQEQVLLGLLKLLVTSCLAVSEPEEEEYTDAATGVRLLVKHDHPDHPLLSFICPPEHHLSYEQVNAATKRLHQEAVLLYEYRPVFTGEPPS